PDVLRRFRGQSEQFLSRLVGNIVSVFRVKFLIRAAVFGHVELRDLCAHGGEARRQVFFDVRQVARELREQVARPVGVVLIYQVVDCDLLRGVGDDLKRVAVSLLYLGGIELRRVRRVRIISRVGDLDGARSQDVQYAEGEAGRLVIGQD